jgi:hypothetical protein
MFLARARRLHVVFGVLALLTGSGAIFLGVTATHGSRSRLFVFGGALIALALYRFFRAYRLR